MSYAAIKSILRLSLLLSILGLAVCYWQKEQPPKVSEILPQLHQPPQQIKTSQSKFTTTIDGTNYTIEPLYDYQLYGAIVSHHNTTAWWDYYHANWGDTINVKDLCVIWGDNLRNDVYQYMACQSGSWTCYVNFRFNTPPVVLGNYRDNALSNNHILTGDKRIKNLLKLVKKWDQIYFKGWLAEYTYTMKDGRPFHRGTSITRDDRNNGACETVYLTEFRILKTAHPHWSAAYDIFKCAVVTMALITLLVYLNSPVYE